MSSASPRAVRLLVAARLRELIEEPDAALLGFVVVLLSPMRPIMSFFEPIARALASAPEIRATTALIAGSLGIVVGRAASARLPWLWSAWSWSRRRHMGAIPWTSESNPTLPVTAFDRLAATFAIAFVLALPFVAGLLLSWAWSPGVCSRADYPESTRPSPRFRSLADRSRSRSSVSPLRCSSPSESRPLSWRTRSFETRLSLVAWRS